MSEKIKKTHDLFGWIICAFLIGPFALLLLRFWKGIILLLLPIFFASAVAYLFLDSQLTKLLHYPLTLEIWGAIYWIISIVAAAEEVKILNRENSEDEDDYFNLRQSPVEKWLQNNPGKSINDYYKYN